MAAVSSVLFQIVGKTDPPASYVGPVSSANTKRNRTILLGDGDGNIERVLSVQAQAIANAAVDNYDLQTDTDVYGDALGANDVALLYIENTGDGDLQFRPNAANGWTGFLAGTTPTIEIPSGGTLLLYSNKENKLAVAGGSKAFDIVEKGTGGSTYNLQVWTRHT